MRKMLISSLVAMFCANAYGNCRIVDREIDVSDIYPFVIFPQTVNVKDAEGECDLTQAQNTHAIFISAAQKRPLKCVAVEFESISILYEDSNGEVIFEDLPDTIATKAACK